MLFQTINLLILIFYLFNKLQLKTNLNLLPDVSGPKIILMFKKALFLLTFLIGSWAVFTSPALSMKELPMGLEDLKILTWNIYMRPRFIFNDGQLERAQAIVEQLKDKTYDVIVFQEAIDRKARKIIWEGLKEIFPFQSEPGNGAFLKTNGGVWILSKYKFEKQKRIIFKGCVGTDCFCRKGATLVEVTKNDKTFQIIGTHLQAEVGDKRYKINRVEQFNEINEFLMKPNYQEGIPQFVVGDMNTPDNISEEYKTMLAALESQDAERNSGEWEDQASWGAWNNDMFDECADRKPEVLDYILFKPNGRFANRFYKSIRKFRQRWNERNHDLSDHFAVEAVVSW